MRFGLRPIAFLIACAAGSFNPSLATAEPRWVDLTEEVARATTVAIVRIDSYGRNRLLCTRQPDNAHLAVMYDSRDTTWNPGRFASSELDSTWAWGATGQGDNRVVWTSLWPPVGSEAVVVSDSTESISLFARRVVGGWRFWSPIFTMSVAVFECDPPARILNPETLFSERGSWDGRIVPDSTVRKWLK